MLIKNYLTLLNKMRVSCKLSFGYAAAKLKQPLASLCLLTVVKRHGILLELNCRLVQILLYVPPHQTTPQTSKVISRFRSS